VFLNSPAIFKRLSEFGVDLVLPSLMLLGWFPPTRFRPAFFWKPTHHTWQHAWLFREEDRKSTIVQIEKLATSSYINPFRSWQVKLIFRMLASFLRKQQQGLLFSAWCSVFSTHLLLTSDLSRRYPWGSYRRYALLGNSKYFPSFSWTGARARAV
jgi:hypothetical protein